MRIILWILEVAAIVAVGLYLIKDFKNRSSSESTINKFNESAMDPQKAAELSDIEEFREQRFRRAGGNDPYPEAVKEMKKEKEEIKREWREEYKKYGEKGRPLHEVLGVSADEYIEDEEEE